MSNYFSTRDILRGYIPTKDKRLAYTKTPNSEANANVLIPEVKFNKTFEAVAKKELSERQNIGKRNQIIRRIKAKDETYATLQLIKAGEVNPDKSFVFEEFLLQSIQEASQEKYQLVETFGETVGFFFGSRPKVYTYSGVLLNTYDYPWRDEWKDFYEKELRGTKCVEKSKRAYLTYDFVVREGYILSMNMSDNSSIPNSLDFNFTMFITKEANLNPAEKKKYEQEAKLEKDLMASKSGSVTNAIIGNQSSAFEAYIDKMTPQMLSEDNGVIGSHTEVFVDESTTITAGGTF